MKALIFDCDGVLVDTERDGHRVAFNRAFAAAGIDAEWDVELYGELLKIAGGKERMTHYFDTKRLADRQDRRDADPRAAQDARPRSSRTLIAKRQPAAAARHRAHRRRGARGRRQARRLHDVGPEGHRRRARPVRRRAQGWFEIVLAGDVVEKKKPDPEIYKLAKAEARARRRATASSSRTAATACSPRSAPACRR